MTITIAAFAEGFTQILTTYHSDPSPAAGEVMEASLSSLFDAAGLILPAQLAARLQQHVELTEQWITQYRAWQVGDADGGPGGDGLFPFVDRNGHTSYLQSPKRVFSELFGIKPRGRVANAAALALLVGAVTGDLYVANDTGSAWVKKVDGTWLDMGPFQGPRGITGMSAFELWQTLPGNAEKTEADFIDWIINAQVSAVRAEVQPMIDAAAGSERVASEKADAAAGSAATAVSSAEAAGLSEIAAGQSEDASAASAIAAAEDRATVATLRGEVGDLRLAVGRDAEAVAADRVIVVETKAAAITIAEEVARDADAAEQARAGAASDKEATALLRQAVADDLVATEDAKRVAAAAAVTATNKAADAVQAAQDTDADRIASQTARAGSEAAQLAAEAARDEAQAIAGGNFQPSDPTLTAVSGQTWTSGRVLFAMTAQDVFAPVKIGADAPGDVPDRAAADLRYRLKVDALDIDDVTGLLAALETKATPADVNAAIAALVGAAPGALDTIYEIAAKLLDNDDALAALLAQIGEKAGQEALDAVVATLTARHEAGEGRLSSLEAVKPVLTVNGTAPDAEGNIIVQTGDVTPSEVVLARTNGVLTTITETVDGDPRITTLSRTNGVLTQTVTTYRGKTVTSTFNRTNGRLTGVTTTEA